MYAIQGLLRRNLYVHDRVCGTVHASAIHILDSIELEQPVRLVGVRLTNLHYRQEMLPLFDEERRKAFMVNAMDVVNDRFGDFTVMFGSLLAGEEKKGSFVISPAWRPDGIRNVPVR